jgi:hypothetical protein
MSWRKHVTLEERHKEYCEAPWFNVSGFVRTMLDLLIIPDEEIPDDEQPEMPMIPAPLETMAGGEGAVSEQREEMVRLALAAAVDQSQQSGDQPLFQALTADSIEDVAPASSRTVSSIQSEAPYLLVSPTALADPSAGADASATQPGDTTTPAPSDSATPQSAESRDLENTD